MRYFTLLLNLCFARRPDGEAVTHIAPLWMAMGVARSNVPSAKRFQ
jgi:hypothetical protein